MPRPILRALGALCAGVLLVAFGLAVWLLPAVRSQAAALFAPGSAAPARYCSNWDFVNNTGQDVNDLHVRLQGVTTVSDIYTGTLNPFGASTTSVYSPTADTYELNFSGATVFDSDRVHIGLCTDTPLLRIGATDPSAFTWTNNGTTVTPNPLFTGLEWSWQGFNHLQVRVVNEQNVTTTLMALNLLDAENALGLDDLNGDVAAQLPLVLDLLDTPRTLAPQSDSFFDVYFNPGGNTINTPPYQAPLQEPNHPYVLEAVMNDATDETNGNTAHLYAQALLPFSRLSLPFISR
ncbi:MAG: hypothetical protein E6J26_05400 [Chloroflexi bacterium]|nr:MAG: hypothetical protein E6J26_05400 [Chloroflexota bacterium]